jgi:predicted small lipoprotein YifL
MRILRIVLFSALCTSLASCGNKGSLVLPDQKPAQPEKSATQDSGKQP